MRRLKSMLEATMDVYTFMRSSMTGAPFLSLQGELELNPNADPLQNEALVQMWLEVKIRPLLQSITRHFLSCLSTKNFSCATYQTVVRDLSQFYSEMDPVRQQWIYTFFMYPFLSRDGLHGCVIPGESSEEWLMKNFGSFRAMARMRDFSTLNMVFSGLEVLHLLSPAQKAELLMMPEVVGVDNGTLSLVFHNLLTGNPGPLPISPNMSHNWTSPAPLTVYSPPPPHNDFREVINGFMTAVRPIGSFVHNFVSFTRERDVSEIRSATLTQFLLNWTLSELADMYRPQNTSVPPEADAAFDVTNVEDWYLHVVMPVLRRFLPNDEVLMQQNIKLAFHELFFLDNRRDNETEIQDVCSITLDGNPCGLTNAVENVARVLYCAARTNLTITEATVMKLIMELTERLSSLIQELSTANFTEVASDLQQIFGQPESPSLTQQHLQDPDFIKLWFPIKLMPLLPNVPPALLSCLSTKNFSCPAYQTIVAALSRHMSFMDTDPMYSRNIYELLIFPFLLNHNATVAADNFGFFFRFASVIDFYKLNPNFNGLDVLDVLTPKQMAEMLLLPLPTPPEKDEVIDGVFDFLMTSPEILPELLRNLAPLAMEVSPPCDVFRQILMRLSHIIPSLPFDLEPLIWSGINELISIAPGACVPENISCPETQFNATNICRRVDSSELQSHLDMVPCNYTLEEYACAQLQNFTANQLTSLLMCDLPGNSSRSTVLWKMLLTELTDVLDPALDMLANMSMPMVGSSASVVLDVIGELRLRTLTDEQLMNSDVIRKWFSERLSAFLPSASGTFLHCLSLRNLSCQAYQQILQVFIQRFDNMTMPQQRIFKDNFIVRFLSRPNSGPGCVNASTDSAEWLRRNVGPFSALFSLRELLDLNPSFNPLEALRLLTPKQTAELLLLDLPTLPDEDVVINEVFDYLTEPPQQQKIPEFLFHLITFLEKGNLSCLAFRTIFGRLDLAMTEVPLDVASNISYAKMALSKHIPPDCIIYSGECGVTMTNETDICVGVNSSMLQLHLDSGMMDGRFCNFSVEEFACASLSALTPEGLSMMLMCNRSSNSSGSRPVWKLLLSKASYVLDRALDLLSNKTLDLTNPALSVVLDAIREIRLDTFSALSFSSPGFIKRWFNQLLRPFLPVVSPDFLSCLAMRGLSCATYQDIVQILSRAQPHMTRARQMLVYTHFIRVFLTRNDTADPSCSLHINNSGEWLQRNLGAFSVLASFSDLQMLYSNFSAMEALPQLSVRQLAEVSASPGQLISAAQVDMLMRHGHGAGFPSVVRSAMLQVVFDRANLSDHSVSERDILRWLQIRLRPLLFNLSPRHVAPFFGILTGRNCSVELQGIEDLNLTISSLNDETRTEIHNHIIQALRGPMPLRCYSDNHSFYGFLEQTFMGFHYNQTPMFLETESLPENVRRPTLPCVWPMALSSSTRPEVNAWFNQRLPNYLPFLTGSLISPSITHNASCLAFQKVVSVLGDFNYTAADFGRADVYNTIRDYLTLASGPRCYNPSDPELNSTAWFAEYIGVFVPFLTLDALQMFGSAEVLQVFTVNPLNLALFNQSFSDLPQNLTNFCVQLIYQQDPNFNPLFLPLSFRCVAPGPAFTQLNADESMIMLYNLTTLCTDLDPQISSALAGNLGNSINAGAITALGSQSVGISTGQIKLIRPQDLFAALGTLSGVVGWNEGQARAIIQALLSSGLLQLNSTSSLITLGSLVMGLPATAFNGISGSQLITASSNPSFLVHLMMAPLVIRQVFITQIISVTSNNSSAIIQNVPDDLATEIPRALLLGFSNNNVQVLNKKKWKQQQAELFFTLVGSESATTSLGRPSNLSSSVLQGFTCTTVRTFSMAQIRRLIRACRRNGRNRVTLVETQLTCMYNYIRVDPNVTSFNLYPPDMLLYYDYSLVPQASCRSYFEQLADADFFIFSSVLRYKRDALLVNARSCLGITNTSLTQDNILVLGNMCCVMDSSYIENSDPSILDVLKTCGDLTAAQGLAAQALLLSGNTQFGAPSTWDLQTLNDLGTLPLYLTSTFYDNFNRRTKHRFLRSFLRTIRRNGVSRLKRRRLRREITESNRNSRSKRSTVNECTVGNITQVTVSDEAFPFGYDDVVQFNCCLIVDTVVNNLDAITSKVDDEEYLRIVLSKLHEAYAANSSVPEDQVQLLGPASRVATVDGINKWSITEIDTLSALMDSSDGEWDPSLAKAVITKYLSKAGNTLGSTELNAIGGVNLCSLDVDVLRSISQDSLREADALDVSSCTTAKKKELFIIARQAFNSATRSTVSVSSYQLTRSFVGGASSSYVRSLAVSDVNMDLATFTSLDENVVLNLTVNEVKGLLGNNLEDLKAYENQTLVNTWIRSQLQSELDTLGIGLVGGRADPTTVAPSGTTIQGGAGATTAGGSGTTAGSTSTTTADGVRVLSDVGLSFLLLLLTLFVTNQNIVM
ncbi:hypothetical protein INR49_016172 [Caranx melampygus]|nr:hypothetical protein INR49_016172 [Caranx melampygus]